MDGHHPSSTSSLVTSSPLSSTSPSLSQRRTLAAIPCYNEELTIGTIVLKAKKYVDEVLVVDDGSTDGTAEVAKAAGATVITHPTNLGYGGALRTCFSYARENDVDAMVVLDGDGQHDPTLIRAFLDELHRNGPNIIIGSRFLNGENGSIPLYRQAGMKLLDKATQVAGNIHISDSQSGYRLYGKQAIEHIEVTDYNMGAGSQILTQIAEHHLTVTEIPITVRYDTKNPSTQNPLSHGLAVLNTILWYVVEKRPLPLLGIPGLLFCIIGIYFGLTLLQLYNMEHYFSLPLSILVAIFTILGVLAIFMSLILHVVTRLQYRHNGREAVSKKSKS